MSRKEKEPAVEVKVYTQEAEETTESVDPRIEELERELAEQKDTYLRLAAEYDNYRKRTAKEKESIWADARVKTAAELLPVYDNLERAVCQQTEDAAYAKGVEMTMTQLKAIFERLDIQEIPALGQTFDPERHNAVSHIENPELGENVVAEVYQAGFQSGDKIIRHAVVVVAN